MPKTKGKFIFYLILAVAAGAAVTAAAFLFAKSDQAGPSTVIIRPSPRPSPSVALLATASPAQQTSSQDDNAAIVAVVRRHLEAATTGGNFVSANVVVRDGNFAVATGKSTGDERPYALKKVNGDWIVLSESKGLCNDIDTGQDSETLRMINLYGFPRSLFNRC